MKTTSKWAQYSVFYFKIKNNNCKNNCLFLEFQKTSKTTAFVYVYELYTCM